jgi:hypothetical protein
VASYLGSNQAVIARSGVSSSPPIAAGGDPFTEGIEGKAP